MSAFDHQQRYGVRNGRTLGPSAPRRATSVSRREPSPMMERANRDGLTVSISPSTTVPTTTPALGPPSPTALASSFSSQQQHHVSTLPSPRNAQPAPLHASNVYRPPQRNERPPSTQPPTSPSPSRSRSRSQHRPQLSPHLEPRASSTSYRPAVHRQLPGSPNLSRSGSATSLTALSLRNDLAQQRTHASQHSSSSAHPYNAAQAPGEPLSLTQRPSLPLPAALPQHRTALPLDPHPHPAGTHSQASLPSSPVDPYDILAEYAYDDDEALEVEPAQPAVQVQDRFEPLQMRQPAPWAFKPRTGDPTGLASAVEANAAPSKPMGLKHEESTTPMPFCIDSDFERVVLEIVPDVDYPETPSLTVRVFVLGTIFNVALAFANTIFSFRTNTFMLTPYVAILLAYPIGKFLEHYSPDYTWYTRWFKLSLNPGPFTVKEHVLIGIWATTGANGVYGTSNIVVQQVFYLIHLPPWVCIAFLVSLNLIGFGFSGLFRRWVIRPIEMVWPSVLPFVSLYSAFHGGLKQDPTSDSDSVIDPSHKSKLRYFFIAMTACFVYHMVGPSYMSAGLTSIPLLCLVVPKSSTFLRTIVGSQHLGVGAFALSLDWSLIGSLSMVTPFWTTLSATVGSVALQWIAAPLGIHHNWFNAPARVLSVANSLDIVTNGDNSGNAAALLLEYDPMNGYTFRSDDYERSKPLHLTPLFALSYFASMAQFMSAWVHCLVWYGGDIWRRFRRVDRHKERLDIHCRYIDYYPEVPQWMYLALLVSTSTVAMFVCQSTEMAMPWYMTLLAIGFSAIACFPIAIILATTGVQLYLNVASQFLVGLLMPGFPLLHMAFKSLAVSVGQQCMTLLADLKLGHYMKIPPRHVFITQVSASIVSALASYGAAYYWLQDEDHHAWISDYSYEHPDRYSPVAALWSSTSNRTFYSASLIWGLIGPRRFFFETQYGAVIFWGLVIGAMTPIVIKMLDLVSGKRIPWKYVQGPLLFTGVIPGSDMSYVFSQFLVGFFFQFYMFRFRTHWWKRFNYILACALDVGVAIATLVVTFGLHNWGVEFPEWALNPGRNPELRSKLNFCQVPQDSPALSSHIQQF